MMKQQSINNYIRGLKYSIPLLFAAMLMLFGSCTDEHTDHPTPSGEEKMITFSVKVPEAFTPATYALTTNDENAVNTVDVLLFESGGNYISGPHYGAIDASKNVTIRIPAAKSKTYDMVILANCRSEINSATFGTQTKETILSGLKRTVTVGNGSKSGGSEVGWLTNGADKTIPMSAETTVVYDAAGTATVTNGASISLSRMLAKINVTNSAGTFNMTSVYLCNYNNEGRIAPNKATWSTSNPSVIASAQTGDAKAILYSGETVISDNKCINEIYTFEAVKGSADNTDGPCIVIGGTYSGETYYYRIDFVDGSSNYWPLLRNYIYDVKITSIGGPGYSSMKQALDSRPVNITYSVSPWTTNSSNVVYSGQYALGVSQGEFLFTKGASSATFTVSTTHSSGWSAEVQNSDGTTPLTDDWLSMSPLSGSSGAASNATLTIAAYSGTPSTPRAAKIKITSGNLEYIVNITQSHRNVEVTVNNKTSETLTFSAPAGQAPTSQALSLSWLPATSAIFFSSENAGNYRFDAQAIPALGQVLGGSKEISVTAVGTATPTKDNPLIDIDNATLTYTIFNGEIPVASTLTLKQQVWNAFVLNGANTSGAENTGANPLTFQDANNAVGSAQNFTLSLPAGSKIEWTANGSIGTYFATPATVQSSGATHTYSIQPKAVLAKGAASVTGNFTCTVTYLGKSVTKTLNLVQKSEFEPKITPSVAYPMDGRSYTVTINDISPSTDIYISTNDNSSSAITNLTNSKVTSNSSGVATVSITTKNNKSGTYPNPPTLPQKDVTLSVSATSGGAVLASAVLNCITPEHKSNSYIINTNSNTNNGKGILIPIQQAYDAMNTSVGGAQLSNWFDGSALSSSLVWKTQKNATLTFDHSVIGSGSDAYLYVRPDVGADLESNAVIGIVKSTDAASPAGKYLWSWHIWVTSYVPTKGTAGQTAMDRNLGASTASQGSAGANGLIYQWGRKDPFPGANGTSSDATLVPIYASNDAATGSTATASTSPTGHPGNLSTVVKNPDKFYTSGGGNRDWYDGDTGIQNDALWGGGSKTKTVYDPCPPGWRIPVLGELTGGTTSGTWNNAFGWQWDTNGTVVTAGGGNRTYQSAWFPASGTRLFTSGNLDYVGSNGYYWLGAPNSPNARFVYFLSSGNVSASSNSVRADGNSVRCLQEK